MVQLQNSFVIRYSLGA